MHTKILSNETKLEILKKLLGNNESSVNNNKNRWMKLENYLQNACSFKYYKNLYNLTIKKTV